MTRRIGPWQEGPHEESQAKGVANMPSPIMQQPASLYWLLPGYVRVCVCVCVCVFILINFRSRKNRK